MTPTNRRPATASPQQRLVTSAAQLFAAQGYASTSVRQIAEHARVSLDTVYARGGKSHIFLRAMEFVLSGTSDGTPLLEAAGMQSVWAAGTLEEIVGGLVKATVRSDERSAAMWRAFVEGASSEPSLASAMAEKNRAMRNEGLKATRFLQARQLCPADLDGTRVADLIWAELHPNRYALLVTLAGWPVEEFIADATDTVLRLLNGDLPSLAHRQEPEPALGADGPGLSTKQAHQGSSAGPRQVKRVTRGVS